MIRSRRFALCLVAPLLVTGLAVAAEVPTPPVRKAAEQPSPPVHKRVTVAPAKKPTRHAPLRVAAVDWPPSFLGYPRAAVTLIILGIGF